MVILVPLSRYNTIMLQCTNWLAIFTPCQTQIKYQMIFYLMYELINESKLNCCRYTKYMLINSIIIEYYWCCIACVIVWTLVNEFLCWAILIYLSDCTVNNANEVWHARISYCTSHSLGGKRWSKCSH